MSAIRIDGIAVPAVEGESLAAVLIRAGHLQQRVGRTGKEHGYFCGMGVCFECVVEIDGLPGQRACSIKVRNGMTVRGQPHLSEVTRQLAEQRLGPDHQAVEEPDVLVIGAGPAGLEAALTARMCGADVLLVDERAAAGGQFYKQLLPTAGRPDPTALDAQMEEGRRLVRSVLGSGVRYRSDTTAWFASRQEDGGVEVGLLTEGIATVARPRCLIVATGATERPYPVPGWTLPGVMTCGGMQTLVRSSRVTPPGRIVVAGNGPLNLQLACELIDAKADVVAVVESAAMGFADLTRAATAAAIAPRLVARGAKMLLKLRRHGARILLGHAVTSIEGIGAVSAVNVAPIGADGSFEPSGQIRLDVDAVALGYGFLPENGIARLLGLEMGWSECDLGSPTVIRGKDLATSMQRVYVVGEAGAFGGANVAMAEGRIAGAAAARACGYASSGESDMSDSHRALARHRRFQRALWGLFRTRLSPLAGITHDTIVCRCEDVTAGQIRTAAREVGNAIGSVKKVTRAGMGRCQGRFCGAVVRHMLSGRSTGSELDLAAPQNPIKPVRIAELAREKGEWGGHKRVPLPPPTKSSCPVTAEKSDRLRCDALVIGGGIVGCCTARSLALAGLDVVLVEAGEVNGQASGANAGSLHVQLLSFDLGEKAENGGGPALRTLPLQKASVDLWEQLAAEIDDDIGFARRGGLMVADDESQMRFLERKAELERSVGVASTVVGAREARMILPALSDHVAGALSCPQEGKINPLLATPVMARLALEAGARFITNSRVEAIKQDSQRWSAKTSRMEVSAKYVVNAAGPWASEIGELAGLTIPVFASPLQMIVTEPVQPMLNVLLSHADRHLTLKQSENGNIIIGGGWHAGLSDTHRHPRPTRESIEGNLWVAQHVLPDLRGLNIIRSWSAININIDGAPILGEMPGKRGLFTAVMSGGYTLGPIAGQITADLVTRGKSEFDLSAFGIERFDRAAHAG